ncbi:alpha/beta fold hydrolase [Actinophytocola sp.]|uniref:alpha/beta fold hydrolase n=1 Tax=Actinophytocola sp. TaxID=1872138 RepID=UPI0025C3AE0B|nr:alpha/beta fold hydrolase [Actinophytocola sp.]
MTAVRTAFGTLERLAPGLGGRWAERLWLTVPPYRGRRADVIPPGEPFTVTVDGRRVAGRTWGSGPVVYLVHGWGGQSAQLRAFLDPLLAAGHRVVTFDALSHGDSDPGALGPRRTTVTEMAAALEAVAEKHGPAHAIIAHSLGGNAVFFALRRGLRAGRLVFLAPMTQPMPYTAIFAATLGFDHRVRARMLERVARRAGVPWSAFDIPSQVPDIAPPPLLTVHDPNDRETRYADSVALAKAWPDAELVTVQDLGHWRLLRDPATVARAVGFVTAGNAGTTGGRAAAG